MVRECRLWNVWRTQPGGGVVWFPRIKEFQLQLYRRAEVTRLRVGGGGRVIEMETWNRQWRQRVAAEKGWEWRKRLMVAAWF